MLSMQERNELIIVAVRGGNSCRAVGEMFGVSAARVWQISDSAGVKSGLVNRLTAAEKQRIRAMFARGILPTHIAHSIGRTPTTVMEYLQGIDLYRAAKQEALWAEAEDRYLKDNYHKPKLSCKKMADKLGRTKNEVIGRAHRLGLSAPTRAQNQRLITIDGRKMSMTQWADHAGIQVGTLRNRLDLGWSAKKAVWTPIREHHRRKDYQPC